MPFIKVEMLSGRSLEQKRELVRRISEDFLEICGGTPETLHIVISEHEKDDWAIGGRILSAPPRDLPETP